MLVNIKEEPIELTDNSSLSNNMPINIKEEPIELSENSSLSNNMPINIKEEPIELSENSSLINNMLLSIKEEPLEFPNISLNNNVLTGNEDEHLKPFNSSSLVENKTSTLPSRFSIKEELELPRSFSLTNNASFDIREKLAEQSDSSQAASTEDTTYVSLKMEIEENSESYDSTISSNIPFDIKENLVEQFNSSHVVTTEDATYVSLKMEIEENAESCDSTFSSVAASGNDRDNLKCLDNITTDDETFKRKHVTEQIILKTGDTLSSTKTANFDEHNLVNNGDTSMNSVSKNPLIRQMTNANVPLPNYVDALNSKSKDVKGRSVWEIKYRDAVVRGVTNETFNLLQSKPSDIFMSKNVQSIINQTSPHTSEDLETIINLNIPSITKEKPTVNPNSILNVKNSATNPALVKTENNWETRDERNDIMRGINRETEEVESIVNKNIPPISKNPESIINQNISSASNQKPLENLEKLVKLVKTGKPWEIRDERNNVMRGFYKDTEEVVSVVNKNIPVTSKNPEPTINPNIPTISKEKPIRNPISILNDESSAEKPVSKKTVKIWEIRDKSNNVMRGINKETLKQFFPKSASSKNLLTNNKSLEKTRAKNLDVFQNKNMEESRNSSVLRSLDGGRNLKHVSENTEKSVNKIQNEVSESIKIINLEVTEKKNGNEFQNKLIKRTYNSRSLLRPLNSVSVLSHHAQNTQNILNKVSKEATESANPEILEAESISSYAAHTSTSLTGDAGKSANKRTSDECDESSNIQSSREAEVKIARQFQKKQFKEKSNIESRPLPSYRAARTNSAFPAEDNGKSVNKIISTHTDGSTVRIRGALVYDRAHFGPPKSALTKLLEPLYKHVKDNKCLLCGFESKANDTHSIKRHLACHLPGKNFKCDICDKLFSIPESLAFHKANAHAKDKREVSCKDCDRKFSSQGVLNCHRRRHHKPAKSYVCSICDHEYKEFSSLKAHYRIHTGEKPYACIVCGATFRTRDSLKVHSLRHNTEKLYSCKLCDKSYNRKELLKEHMNSHKGTSDIKCHVCGKTFNYKSNLAQHMFVHSDIRPHKCETCGLKFKLSHHLRSHLATHHT